MMDNAPNDQDLARLNARLKTQFAAEFVQMMTEVSTCAVLKKKFVKLLLLPRLWNLNASLVASKNLEWLWKRPRRWEFGAKARSIHFNFN